MISPNHPMVWLADEIDWARFDEAFGMTYSDKGRPGISTRLMVALHYLKYTYDLSDDDVIWGWVENPHRQYLGRDVRSSRPPGQKLVRPKRLPDTPNRVGQASTNVPHYHSRFRRTPREARSRDAAKRARSGLRSVRDRLR